MPEPSSSLAGYSVEQMNEEVGADSEILNTDPLVEELNQIDETQEDYDWELPLRVLRIRRIVDSNYAPYHIRYSEKKNGNTEIRWARRWSVMDGFIVQTYEKHSADNGDFSEEHFKLIWDEYRRKYAYNYVEVLSMTILVNRLIGVKRMRYKDKMRQAKKEVATTSTETREPRLQDFVFGTLPSFFPLNDESQATSSSGVGTLDSSGEHLSVSMDSEECVTTTAMGIDQNRNIFPSQ